MAGSTGPGSGMMIMVILLLLLSSSASAGGGYFYMNREDTKEDVEDEFQLKYQEAARALAAERAAQQNINVAKTALELAQDELEIARLAFEGKEFANEAEKSAARARLYAAEQDVDTAAFRLSEAETDAETAATRRDTAEENANSALENAITINTMIEANAVADAIVMVTLAQGKLEAAKSEWESIIGDANAAAANVIIAADAQAYAAYKGLEEAQSNHNAAKTNLETTEVNLSAAKNREATALIAAAESLGSELGEGTPVICSANDVGGGPGAVYRNTGTGGVLRHYPSPGIASSWDPDWDTTKQSIDCLGFTQGPDMMANETPVAAIAPARPVLTTGTGGPHNGGIVWQSHDIGGRFHSPPGLIWLGGNGPGDQPWDQSYKFRCENNGSVSAFSPTYGPARFRTYHKPKIQVSDEGTTPCNINDKLEIWDANTDNNITPLMKNFIGTAAYNGTDNSFWDPRDIGTTTPAPTGTCTSKVKGMMADGDCPSLTGWDCANRSSCKLV